MGAGICRRRGGGLLRLRPRGRPVHRGAFARRGGRGAFPVRRHRGLEKGRQADASKMSAAPPPVGFAEAFRFWLKLGFISFGGPTGQIAIMHQGLGERRRWISEKRFLHALNYCMVLQGPEAQQLATYIGWVMHRTRGGVASGGLFALPFLVIPTA